MLCEEGREASRVVEPEMSVSALTDALRQLDQQSTLSVPQERVDSCERG